MDGLQNTVQGAVINQPNKIYGQRLHCDQNQPLKELIKAPGVTVLDRCLVNKEVQAVLSNNGIGAEIKAALKERQQILVERGLARSIGEQDIIVNNNLLDSLRKQELANYKNMLRKDGYNVYDEVPRGFVGSLKKMVKLSGINYGLVTSKEQNLVIVPITNKDFLKLQNKNVAVSYRVMNHGTPKIIIKPIGKELII